MSPGIALALLLLASQAALAQRPAVSFKPVSDTVVRECVGGPDAGQVCATTADCENDDGGAMNPACQRLCDGDPNQPCVTSLDCASGIACEQQCFCNFVLVSHSVLFAVDIFASGWSPHELAWFEVVIDYRDIAERVLPFGWDRPEPPIPCSSPADCPARYPICSDGECEGPNHYPSASVITKDYPPGCEFGCCKFCTVDIATLRYRFGCSYVYSSPQSYPPVTDPKWLATLLLGPTRSACGTVTITPLSPPYSGLFDEHGMSMEPLGIEGLNIEFRGHCRVDCNQNSEPDDMEKLEPGDFDFNHTIDLADFAAFQRCFYGTSYGYDDPCPCVFDFNGNLVVDRGDLHGLTSRLTGP